MGYRNFNDSEKEKRYFNDSVIHLGTGGHRTSNTFQFHVKSAEQLH
jgi:hypothetical protein